MAYVQSLSQVMSPQDLPYVGLSLATESHAFINGILFTAVKKKKKKKKNAIFMATNFKRGKTKPGWCMNEV